MNKLNKIKNGQIVVIKTKEQLEKEGYLVDENGAFKDGKMYLNLSDLSYLGWEMKINCKKSVCFKNKKINVYDLSVLMSYCEIDMYNIEESMFVIKQVDSRNI